MQTALLDVGRYDRVKVTELNSSGSRERLVVIEVSAMVDGYKTLWRSLNSQTI